MSELLSKSLMLSKIQSHYEYKSKTDFAQFLGITYSVLSNWYSRNTMDFEVIATKCVDISGDWLLSEGQGEMLKSNAKRKAYADSDSQVQTYEPSEEYVLQTDKRIEKQRVPLYDTQAAAGLTQVFAGKPNVIDYISIPNLPKCDGAMYMTGDSMYPLLKSGDIIFYKQIKDIQNGILWGEMYVLSFLIDYEDYTIVKYIQKSELGPDFIKLVSQNQHHSPKDIPLSSITAMAMIKASIRFNSMN